MIIIVFTCVLNSLCAMNTLFPATFITVPGDRVVILGLQQFSTPSGRLNILQQVGTDYKPMLGNILLKSQNGKRVQTIETTFGHNVDNVVYDIFQKWSSEDGDCTWGKLVQCLRDSNLNPLANDIDSCLL